MIDHNRQSLLVFADDWGRHPSSCQHLAARLLDRYDILWVNTIGTRRVRANSLTFRRACEKLKNWRKGLSQVREGLWVTDLPMLPSVGRSTQFINQRLVSRRLKKDLQSLGMAEPVVLTTLPYVHWMIRSIRRRALLYYCTDDYSHWPGADREALLEADDVMSQLADIVLPVSRALLRRYENRARCEYFPHGVDFNHFSSARNITEPAEALSALKSPRIGFFGLIYEKIDFALLSKVAKHLPAANLVMIGPVDYCEESFSALPNVHMMGRQPYEDLPKWIAGLDVLLLPYRDDEMIRQSGPLKLRECLASGKPTVSVDVPEVRVFEPHVRVGSTDDEFIRHVEEAMNETDPQTADRRQMAVSKDSWENRAEQLIELIDAFKCPDGVGHSTGVTAALPES